MTNNDFIRQMRYIFDYSDKNMVEIFALAEQIVTQEQVTAWLKKEDEPRYQPLYDKDLASFLNGFINQKRGKREGPQPKPEKSLTNNMKLRKLKIALNFKEDDMLSIFENADLLVSKHELSALFRKPGQSQYRPCKDQFLRNFMFGLKIKFRPNN